MQQMRKVQLYDLREMGYMVGDKMAHYLQSYLPKVLVSKSLVSYVVYCLAKHLRGITSMNLKNQITATNQNIISN